jgi:hypothetical protein
MNHLTTMIQNHTQGALARFGGTGCTDGHGAAKKTVRVHFETPSERNLSCQDQEPTQMSSHSILLTHE